jgi:oxygen-independent coproporphyrinogen-3 oxidase
VAIKDKVAMLAAIKKEISLRKNYIERHPVQTLYFGGGTPSVLSINELSDLIETIRKYYTFSKDAEITIETNPEHLTISYLAGLRALGFNRLSIGIQSFLDDDLRWMNRGHTSVEAKQSVKYAQDNGFDNINIDLIYGLPSLTTERWKFNINQAIALYATHVSAYHLIIEDRSVFGKRKKRGEVFDIPEDTSIAQFELLLDDLELAGYEHYEISNFARKGFKSKHNVACWQQKPYIGFGPSAHSFDGQCRRWNINNNSKYITALETDSSYFDSEQLTTADKYNEYILASIRASWGVDIQHIKDNFGDYYVNNFKQEIWTYLQHAYVQENTCIYTLTRKGKFVADKIASDVFVVE